MYSPTIVVTQCSSHLNSGIAVSNCARDMFRCPWRSSLSEEHFMVMPISAIVCHGIPAGQATCMTQSLLRNSGNPCDNSGSHGSEYENDSLLGYSACSLVEVDRRFRGASGSWWWRQYTPLKRLCTSSRLHCAISKKAFIFSRSPWSHCWKNTIAQQWEETLLLGPVRQQRHWITLV
jgi:hypothetical protein